MDGPLGDFLSVAEPCERCREPVRQDEGRYLEWSGFDHTDDRCSYYREIKGHDRFAACSLVPVVGDSPTYADALRKLRDAGVASYPAAIFDRHTGAIYALFGPRDLEEGPRPLASRRVIIDPEAEEVGANG